MYVYIPLATHTHTHTHTYIKVACYNKKYIQKEKYFLFLVPWGIRLNCLRYFFFINIVFFIAIKFSLRSALNESLNFGTVCFHLHLSQNAVIFLLTFFFNYFLFRKLLLNFHIFMNFSIFLLLLIPSFIVAITLSRGSSQPRNQTWVSCLAGRFFTIWSTREALGASSLKKKQSMWMSQVWILVSLP